MAAICGAILCSFNFAHIPATNKVAPCAKNQNASSCLHLRLIYNNPYIGLFKKDIWNKSAYIHRNSAKTLRFIVGYIRQVCALDKSAVFFSNSHLTTILPQPVTLRLFSKLRMINEKIPNKNKRFFAKTAKNLLICFLINLRVYVVCTYA